MTDRRNAPSPAAQPGYSGTPQLRKLGITEHTVVHTVDRPAGWDFTEPLPHGAVLVASSDDLTADVVLAFVRESDQLRALAAWGTWIFPRGALWVAWPRKAAGHVSDMTEQVIRDAALPLGLVDTKVAAIDDDWSGLKLVWRKELRAQNSPPHKRRPG
jgi:hypothetical protein